MSSEHDDSVADDFICCSAGNLCENELTLTWSELNAFIERHDIDLSDTVSVNYTRSDTRAGALESTRVDEFTVSDPAGGTETLDEAYQAVSDDTEKTIQNALTDLVEDPSVVDDVLGPLRNWKHGSYKIHTPEAVPDRFLNQDGYAHYAQTHELACKEALELNSDVRNDTLSGDDPTPDAITLIQYIHGLSRTFLREHLETEPPFTLYRGIGGVAFGDVGRQLLDADGPDIEIDEEAALANFTPSLSVAGGFRGLILSISVPETAIVLVADQLFKCRDEDGELTNCHAEIRIATECYSEVDPINLLLPSGTNAIDFLEDPTTDDVLDHRFMTTLLNEWFGDTAEQTPQPGPETTRGFDRIEEWYDHYETLLERKQLAALEAGQDELADRLDERLSIVTQLKRTATAVRNERGL